jgi:serine phosphatase RsbU (regulator of sigma subunit)/pSer/pThr/pTyr-binding forkhead associated (FHA) protein
MAYLQEFEGFQPGRRHALVGDRMVLGRHPDCDVVIESAAVSRQHAHILRIDGGLFIEDLGSRNGTFVNGQLVQGRQRLVDGDRVRVCEVALQFSDSSGSSSRTDVHSSSLAVMVDDEPVSRLSSVTSKVDVASAASGMQLAVRPEAKLRALLEITHNLSKTLDLDELYPKLLDSLFKIFIQADRGCIVMRTPGGALVPTAVRHRRADCEDMFRISRTIVNHVLDTKKAILSADAASDERFDMSQSIVEFRIRSMLCAPIVNNEGQALGVIEIDTLDQRNRFQDEDLDVLAAIATQAAVAIDNAALHAQLLTQLLAQRQVQRDLELARKVQQSMLPTTPPLVEGYHFFDFYRSAYEVGGDYYDYIELPSGRVAVVVADVSGKGIPAALLMARLSSDVRYCLASEATPAAAVRRLNAGLTRQGWQDSFVTLVLVLLDPRAHTTTIVNAGHLPPLLRHGHEEVCDVASDVAGLPLGVVEDFPYEQYTLELAPGDFITLYTDGISEAMNQEGALYGTDRIRRQVGTDIKSVVELGRHILDDVKSFVGDHSQSDDICLTCFGRDHARDTTTKRSRRTALPESTPVG